MSSLALYRGIYTEERFHQLYGAPEEPEGSLAGVLKGRLARCCRCSRAAALHFLRDRLPIASWLPRYQPKEWLLGDVVAGLTVGIVHIPQGMAFALLTSVAPVYGLYTSFFPALLYMLFGTGRHVSTGTFAVVSLMTGSVVERLVPVPLQSNGTDPAEIALLEGQRIGVAAAMAFFMGLLMIGMFTFHLGFLSTYLSEPVIKAFTSGAALHVVVSQLQSLLGLPLPRPDGWFTIFKTLVSVVEAFPLTNIAELLISGLCLAVLVPIKEINNRYRSRMWVPIPGEIIMAVLACINVTSLRQMFLQFQDLPELWRISHVDFAAWVVTWLSVVVINVDLGLAVGVLFSMMTVVCRTQRAECLVLGRAADTEIYRPVKDNSKCFEISGVKILSYQAPIYYGNRTFFRDTLNRLVGLSQEREPYEDQGPDIKMHISTVESSISVLDKKPGSDTAVQAVVLDCSGVAFVDSAGARLLIQVCVECQKAGVQMHLAACNANVLRTLSLCGLMHHLHPQQIFVTVHDAASYLQQSTETVEQKDPTIWV